MPEKINEKINAKISDKKCIGIAGDGRVARHFIHYLELLGIPSQQWSRRAFPRGKEQPEDFLKECQVVLLLVSDPAIDELAARFVHAKSPSLLFHFSGAFVSQFEQVHGAHPLMTFGAELYDLDSYRRIPFVVEAQALHSFNEFLLGHETFSIPRDAIAKARYHAYCSVAGSLSSFLWAKLFSELPAQFGIASAAAVPFLERLSQNLAEHPDEPKRFFTGPIARGDTATLQKHLDALGDDPFAAVYRAFIKMNQEHPLL